MNSGKEFSAAMQDVYQQNQLDARHATLGKGGGGGGIGNLSGWILFAVMAGATVGFFGGGGAKGAVIGALLFGGLLWAPVAFFRRGGENGASRTSVILWAMGGGLLGVVAAVVIALAWDIVFLKELPVGTMIFYGALAGAVGLGGFRLGRR